MTVYILFANVISPFHSVGSKHDGDGNDCPTEAYYVMEATLFHSVTDYENNTNKWTFSRCSLDYFTAFINTLGNG